MSYPNYRISVELIFEHEGMILLTKRSEHSKVAPGVWNVPAGKVKYEEIPVEAVHREALEETGLRLQKIKEISVRNQSWISQSEKVYRVIYTYVVQAENEDYSKLELNDEHSEFKWISREDLQYEEYATVHPELKRIMLSME